MTPTMIPVTEPGGEGVGGVANSEKENVTRVKYGTSQKTKKNILGEGWKSDE